MFQRPLIACDRRIGHRCSQRRGVAAVELAVVSVPIFLLLFAAIEFGRVQMAIGALEEAARSGCRVATLKNNTTADVQAAVARVVNGYGISNFSVVITPSVLSSVPQWDPITVRVSADLDDLSWLPIPDYFANQSYTAACVFPREADLEF